MGEEKGRICGRVAVVAKEVSHSLTRKLKV